VTAAGIVVALAAQGSLYLTLRHMATAHRPAWADHLHRPTDNPWPSSVQVDVVHGARAKATAPEPDRLPEHFIAPPVVEIAPPLLSIR